MKAKEALNLLRVTRQTLCHYVDRGMIKVTLLKNGHYDYNDESVYNFLNRKIVRKTVIYGRVSTNKQKKDLENQIELLKSYALMNGMQVGEIYSDTESGISFEKREQFFTMLDEIIKGNIGKVLIAYKDRLSRVGFELFEHLFRQFGCKIIVISEVGSAKLDSEEIFEEIVNLLHCYSMKLYSARKRKKVEELLKEEETN